MEVDPPKSRILILKSCLHALVVIKVTNRSQWGYHGIIWDRKTKCKNGDRYTNEVSYLKLFLNWTTFYWSS